MNGHGCDCNYGDDCVCDAYARGYNDGYRSILFKIELLKGLYKEKENK